MLVIKLDIQSLILYAKTFAAFDCYFKSKAGMHKLLALMSQLIVAEFGFEGPVQII